MGRSEQNAQSMMLHLQTNTLLSAKKHSASQLNHMHFPHAGESIWTRGKGEGGGSLFLQTVSNAFKRRTRRSALERETQREEQTTCSLLLEGGS